MYHSLPRSFVVGGHSLLVNPSYSTRQGCTHLNRGPDLEDKVEIFRFLEAFNELESTGVCSY